MPAILSVVYALNKRINYFGIIKSVYCITEGRLSSILSYIHTDNTAYRVHQFSAEHSLLSLTLHNLFNCLSAP